MTGPAARPAEPARSGAAGPDVRAAGSALRWQGRAAMAFARAKTRRRASAPTCVSVCARAYAGVANERAGELERARHLYHTKIMYTGVCVCVCARACAGGAN